jgi:hypothetical protein
MQYNLTFYGLYNNYCTSTNNNIDNKTNYIKTIISYAKPDILAVNEIDSSRDVQNYLLNNVFILNGFEKFKRGKQVQDYLSDQIFYNSHKFTLKKQTYISTTPRKTKIYKFYYNSPDLANKDTVFFYVLLIHMKAGNKSSDSLDRINEANAIMTYINNNLKNSNYILCGDLNLYSSNEKAYKILTNYSSNPSIEFVDAGPAGDWHNNSSFANYQTQSTNFYSTDCLSGGGLDDKFDFTMFSNAIKNNTKKMKYIANSYKIIGQDGQHFNDAVDYRGNNSVPDEVLKALKNNSDHLPTIAEFEINQTPTAISKYSKKIESIKIFNTENLLFIQILNNELQRKNIKISIFNTLGDLIKQYEINTSKGNRLQYTLPISGLQHNIYFIKISTKDKLIKTDKFIK